MSNPPSSPTRLPSPPPFPEIQIGPKSPSLGEPSDMIHYTMEQSIIEANARRRIHPGTKAALMAPGPPLVRLEELESAFQLQEHLKALHYYHTKPVNADHTVPVTRETATIIATPPEGIDPSLWLYELCRFLINKCNDLIVGFLFDDPACSSVTCPEMRASEWQFLCAVHEPPKSCCAIDYCCHTLDWATNIVTSQKIFPNFDAGGDLGEKRDNGRKHLVNIFRRLHRIFAHAWFQHRGVFWQVESQTGLYVLFKTICDTHETLPAENFKLPPEAEGLEQIPEVKHIIPSILQKNTNRAPETPDMYMSLGRTNTKRHKSSPSTGSSVTTVLEIDEAEEDHNVTERLDEMFFARESPVLAESEAELELGLEAGSEAEPQLTLESDVVPEAVPAPEVEVPRADVVSEASQELQGEPDQEAAPIVDETKSLPVIFTPSEDLVETIIDGNEAEEKASENGVEGKEAYEDLDEAAELELEAFEEVPISHLNKAAAALAKETEEPVTTENEVMSDEKTTSEAEVEPSHKVTIEEIPDDEENPDSEVS